MSGRYAPHLMRRNGIYHFRMRVPEALKSRVGLTELKRSLQTYRFDRARLLAAILATRVTEVFSMIEASQLSKDDVRRLVQRVYADLIYVSDNGISLQTTNVDEEITEQRALASEYLRHVESQSNGGPFSDDVRRRAELQLAPMGVKLSDGGGDVDVLTGVVRAFAEQQRNFLFRLDERLAPYQPQDGLFSASPATATPAPHQTRAEEPIGPALGELAERYLKARKSSWTPKTRQTNGAKIALLVDFLGADRAASSITPSDIRDFRDGLLRLRAKHWTGAGTSFASRQTEVESARIQPKTAALTFETCRAFFKWAVADAYLKTNPADTIQLVPTKQPKAKRTRRPFKADELIALFSAPLFRGCRSPHRRFEPGPNIVRDARYWVPIIGHYTGMRLGEIVQLHLDDVRLEEGVWFLAVEETADEHDPASEFKHVKSDAGVRRVPMHPDLIELGFPKWVQERKRYRRSSRRLFPEVRFGADGQASTTYSKWFSRFLDSVGLSDPGLVFHSFRHGAEDAFRDALTPKYVIDRIIGHVDPSVSADYGEGASLPVLAGAVAAMNFRGDVRRIIIGTADDMEVVVDADSACRGPAPDSSPALPTQIFSARGVAG
jgi:integrase